MNATAADQVTRRERIKSTTMEPYMDGTFHERAFEGFAWRCDGCGLVWDRKHLAVNCTSRQHVPSFVQTYYGRGYVLNGVFQGPTYDYTRQSLRREQVR